MPHLSLLQPQEIEVFFILPALRREFAMAMKLEGHSQKRIAQLLGVTEPAVSQYLNAKRATKVNFPPALKKSIGAASKRIVDERTLIRETQQLLTEARRQFVTCQLHEELVPSLKNCRVCMDENTVIQVGNSSLSQLR